MMSAIKYIAAVMMLATMLPAITGLQSTRHFCGSSASVHTDMGLSGIFDAATVCIDETDNCCSSHSAHCHAHDAQPSDDCRDEVEVFMVDTTTIVEKQTDCAQVISLELPPCVIALNIPLVENLPQAYSFNTSKPPTVDWQAFSCVYIC